MTWQGLHGHDEIVSHFRHSLKRGRLGGTFLFVGPPGIGKRSFALRLAQSLLCPRHPPEQLDPCGQCEDCQQVLAGTHPDVEQLAKPADRSFIPLELLIGDRQHRLREGLCARIALRPARGRRKVAIIDDADRLNLEGANCLLKTLEEPPPGSVLILIGTSPQRQLPTIRSRCQIVRFQPLDEAVAAQLLLDNEIVDSEADALRLARASGGSLAYAAEMASPELWQFREAFHATLDADDWDNFELAGMVNEFVDAAGTAAPARRQRLKQVVEMAIEFYRHLLYVTAGAQSPAFHDDQQRAVRLAEHWQHDSERAVRCLERCLAALRHVDANANKSTNIDAWLDDLARLARGENVLV